MSNNTHSMKQMLKLFESADPLGTEVPAELPAEVPTEIPATTEAPITSPPIVAEAFEDDKDEDDSPPADEELISDFEEAYEELTQVIETLEQLVRRLPPGTRDRASSYWLGHLKSATNSNEYGYGGHETDLAGTIREIGGG